MTKQLITYSSELMEQFKQAEVAAAEAKFETLQTDNGYSQLYSIGTDGVFYVTEEQIGHTTGWEKTDLSSELAADFGGLPVQAHTFAVAQNRQTYNIDLAVVVTASDGDHLYLSLGNSSSDTSWVKQPKWVRFPFDDLAHPLSRIVVVNVFINHASDGQYIVVDVLRDPADQVPVVFRYYVDPFRKVTGHVWNPHDVSGDLDTSKLVSCLGRRKQDSVDGIYTLGSIDGHDSLTYQKLYNPFRPNAIPSAVRLLLPDDAMPSAIAAVAVDGDLTDLYVAGRQALYYFPQDKQKDGGMGIKLLDHPIFEEVSRLFAFATAQKIIIWGLNRAQQVFYTTCERSQVENPTAWSYPLPILESAEQISPYVNRVNDGHVFFAHTGVNQLQKVVQTPETTTWKFENILLPTLPSARSVKYNAYTTRLHVTDADKKPLANAKLNVSAVHRSNFYINTRYYILDKTPIAIETDAMGGLVIVETAHSLQANCLRVQGENGAILTINPMDKPFQKVSEIDSPPKLANAVITHADGSTSPLIATTTSSSDQQKVVDAIGSLVNAYQTLPTDGSIKASANPVASLNVPSANIRSFAVQNNEPVVRAVTFGFTDFGDAIEVAAGDLLNYLKSAENYVIHIVQEVGEEVWHFVAEIAGKAYRFVLNATAKVLEALEYIFKAIKTALTDLFNYLKFLFNWKDFVRTKDVMKKMLLLYCNHVLDDIDGLKEAFNQKIGEAKAKIDDWAGVKQDDWHSEVNHSNQTPGYLRTITDYAEVFTAPGMYLLHQVLDHLPYAQDRSQSSASVDLGEEVINRVIQSLTDEGNVLLDAVNRIRTELVDSAQYESLSLSEVLKKLTAIIVDAMLNSAEDLIDLLLDVFVMLVRATVETLDMPIWIPVVSDILEDGLGINISFSLLDVFCMVGAIPATLVYKAIKGGAPFSTDDGFSSQILAVHDVYELQAAFGQNNPSPVSMLMANVERTVSAKKDQSAFVPVKLPSTAQDIIYLTGHLVGGVVSTMTAVLSVADAMAEEGTSPYGMAVGVSAIVGGITTGLPAIVAQPYPIQNPVMSGLGGVTTPLTLLGKVTFKVAPSAIARARKMTDAEQIKSLTQRIQVIGAGFDAIIAVTALVPSCYHFYELSKLPASQARSEAFIDETSSICNYLSRVAAFTVQLDKDPESKGILAAIMGGLILLYSGLQMGEAITETT